ncbi:hypothetical protein NOK12_11100 [Nocardioides sp. OK12]|uniref:DUF3180 domain-containing protein n=1 Tax=Nocardioides sp. OK12 TaxID=2758661 RepID=UPI0021C2F5E2|nr:DUF3180 domain-containing protein [Nocardioides sp. OK12]GHJ58592.1 hypothetical protein NOK12_11100 [Nocardioides sp. OK12]
MSEPERTPEQPPGRPPGQGWGRAPASPALLTAAVVVGLVAGWLARPVSTAWLGSAPVVTWVQPTLLAMLALVIGVTARHTHTALQVRREPMEPHRAVNRLAFGRASAYVGALVGAGYAGYALSWLGLNAELAGQRMLWSGLAALAGVGVVACGLLLERACRVPGDDSDA